MVPTTALFHSGDGGDSGFFPQWQQSAKDKQLMKACFHGGSGNNGLFPWRQW